VAVVNLHVQKYEKKKKGKKEIKKKKAKKRKEKKDKKRKKEKKEGFKNSLMQTLQFKIQIRIPVSITLVFSSFNVFNK
jgi:hypothetical protein